ncbi:leucine-rich repeat neuronal protein 2 [Lampris incognitus]|uniref:leucine-rich repeat neuronal protein 2 n=1 Tax=Lampris incognitus TaxID=2546036 RepID=UPI0024B56B28|nr:leucine-rich repeat neuronal protein 2 [Lampris incognitus]
MVIHSLPWHVSCPVRCACQIKPWFSPDSAYHEAPTVDCNNLLLSQLPLPLPQNIHTLSMQSNLLSALERTVLHGLPNLTELDLSQNRFRKVSAITQNSSLPSLLSLHLEENQLSHLPQASFSSLPALQELFLSHNRLHSLAPGAFAGLDSLLRLHINNNRLTTVDPRWFQTLLRLEVLMLGGNPVEVLPEQGFQALRSLRSLVLGEMGLRVLTEKALDGLDGLESLSFYDNRLTQVPTQALRRVPGLKFLDLNKNRIKVVSTGDFRDMMHLKELGLNNIEELVSIERAALENLPELTKLEITNNPHLSYIHPQAFIHLIRLESLMLNSNSLAALHQHTLLSLPSLQEVSLHSNPLRCDCLFRWAAEEALLPHADMQVEAPTARAVRFIQPQATLCSEPPELRARRVKEVSAREMSASCLPTILPGPLPSYVRVREGDSLALYCRALADPQPKLYWVTPSGLKLAPSIRSSHYKLQPDGTLEINMATPSEAGLYTCIAENVLGADTRSVTVGVHGKQKKQRKETAAHLRRYPTFRAEVGLEVREVGEYFAVLSWKNGYNLPSTRLSWQAISSDEHMPTYSTRVLAGTQSFNLTHLQAETFYRVCLHLGLREVFRDSSRGGRGSGRPNCVPVRTREAPEPKLSMRSSPELTSSTLILVGLALFLLMLASQGWNTDLVEVQEKHHSIFVQVMGHEANVTNQKAESCETQPGQCEKVHQHC